MGDTLLGEKGSVMMEGVEEVKRKEKEELAKTTEFFDLDNFFCYDSGNFTFPYNLFQVNLCDLCVFA